MNLKKYTLQQLQEAVNTSVCIRECLAKLGVAPMGGNYDVFRKAVKHFEIDTSHFTGQSGSSKKLKGKFNPQIPLDEILVEGSDYNTSKLRIRLLRDGILEPVCSRCKLSEWLDGPIPLELDHISGFSTDNRIENLRLLCPNCHALTPTHRGKNMRHLRKSMPL